MRWIVRNGKDIKFWAFNWAQDHPLLDYIPEDSRHLINIDETKHDQIELINKLWKLNIQPKVKMFGWLLLRERLKTRGRLSRFGLINDNSCPLCQEDNETTNHLFGYCNVTKAVWNLAALDPQVNWNEGYLKVFNELFLLQPCSAVTTALGKQGVIVRASLLPTNPKLIRWQTPSGDHVKINFDGSILKGSAAGGFVIRDFLGKPLLAATRHMGKITVPVAEAVALHDSLHCALERGFMRIEVEGDSKLVIDAVCGLFKPPWRLFKIIKDIRTLASQFESISFKHVLR
ncbi:uncharacterized protein LOC133730471 [Rosa rugosa]|uniref:uncharacterized protein LOC133730471 n=1 Tax=Rosa rugosa TaxID=74645 RepID=UPI002B413FE1|nr:uncharacterized protein LOC133730471 [Rosa rugosa]